MSVQYETLDSHQQQLTLLLKGPPGCGKTFKAAQFPKPVFFNFDNNLAGLKKLPESQRKGIRIKNPQMKDGKLIDSHLMWDNFIAQLNEVLQDPEIRTVVIDSLTTLAERLMDKIKGTDNPTIQITQKDWGDFGKYLKWLGDELMCNPSLDKNVIVIAHEQIERDELTQNITFSLSIGGKTRSTYDLYFSDSWRCYAKTGTAGPTEYRVRVAPTSQFGAKCSLQGIPEDFKWDDVKDKILAQVK